MSSYRIPTFVAKSAHHETNIYFSLEHTALLSCRSRRGKEGKAKTDYRPVVHGTLRGKYEYQPEEKAGRFQVRTARVSIEGKVAPVVAYKAEIDLSDEGKIKMLDAYTRLSPLKGFDFTIGQMRVRSPSMPTVHPTSNTLPTVHS